MTCDIPLELCQPPVDDQLLRIDAHGDYRGSAEPVQRTNGAHTVDRHSGHVITGMVTAFLPCEWSVADASRRRPLGATMRGRHQGCVKIEATR